MTPMWLRASSAALAFLLTILTAPVVLSGFLPDAPGLRNLSRLVLPYLPIVLGLSIVGFLLAIPGVRLGGRRFAKAVAIVSFATLLGATVMTARVGIVAGLSGVRLSLARLVGLASTPAPTPDSVVTYATVDGQPLHAALWGLPGSTVGPLEGDVKAVVMYVHGGSFTGGGIGNRPSLFRALTERGFPVMDVEYRLAPPPRWDQAPGDVLCALGWLEANATGLQPGLNRIVVIGDSAGGALALLAAYGAGSGPLNPSCPIEVHPPVAVIAMEPAADLAGIWADESVGDASGRFPESYIGGTPAQYPERYAAASPLSLIRPFLPATLLIAAENDHLILPARTRDLAGRLAAVGNNCWILTVPYAEHGIAAGPDDYGAQILESVIPTFIDHTLDVESGIGDVCG
jgi:acetyl esterase/lipase